jgi:hypothetical protein
MKGTASSEGMKHVRSISIKAVSDDSFFRVHNGLDHDAHKHILFALVASYPCKNRFNDILRKARFVLKIIKHVVAGCILFLFRKSVLI